MLLPVGPFVAARKLLKRVRYVFCKQQLMQPAIAFDQGVVFAAVLSSM